MRGVWMEGPSRLLWLDVPSLQAERAMTLSNLPPGVSDSDIPGNTAEDAAFDRLYDQIALSVLTAEEAKRRWESQPDLLHATQEASLFIGDPRKDEYLDDRSWRDARKIAATVRKAIAKAEGR